MLAGLRTRLTFANVCSFLALLIALGTGSAYAANTVFSTDIVDGEVKVADLDNNAVTTGKIRNGHVGNLDLAADAVEGSKVLDTSIAHADLANDGVNSANVVNESLTASDLATDSVNATEIANNAIDSGEIAADSLLASDLAGASVGASELQDAAVGSAELASNAVSGAKVAGNSLTTADIAGADVNGGGISVPTGYVPNGRCRQLDAIGRRRDGGRGGGLLDQGPAAERGHDLRPARAFRRPRDVRRLQLQRHDAGGDQRYPGEADHVRLRRRAKRAAARRGCPLATTAGSPRRPSGRRGTRRLRRRTPRRRCR